MYLITGPAPLNVAEYEKYAKDTLSRNTHGYYASGSNDMITLRENRAAYSRLRLMPKILVDVSSISTGKNLRIVPPYGEPLADYRERHSLTFLSHSQSNAATPSLPRHHRMSYPLSHTAKHSLTSIYPLTHTSTPRDHCPR